ncbi:MAG: hypothetical protein U0795_20785 [Pirellulales bacterium]
MAIELDETGVGSLIEAEWFRLADGEEEWVLSITAERAAVGLDVVDQFMEIDMAIGVPGRRQIGLTGETLSEGGSEPGFAGGRIELGEFAGGGGEPDPGVGLWRELSDGGGDGVGEGVEEDPESRVGGDVGRIEDDDGGARWVPGEFSQESIDGNGSGGSIEVEVARQQDGLSVVDGGVGLNEDDASVGLIGEGLEFATECGQLLTFEEVVPGEQFQSIGAGDGGDAGDRLDVMPGERERRQGEVVGGAGGDGDELCVERSEPDQGEDEIDEECQESDESDCGEPAE